MYDAQKVGLVQIAPLWKNNDYAIWLKVIRKTDCHLLSLLLTMGNLLFGALKKLLYVKTIEIKK